MKIQIYGERCSGTNYLQKLIENNIHDVFIEWEYGYKHWFNSCIPEDKTKTCDTLFIFISRNACDWLRSLHKKPHCVHSSLKDITFSKFIKTEWQCVLPYRYDNGNGSEMMCERDPDTNNRFQNVIRLRNKKYNFFWNIQHKVKHFIHIQYEDLKADPKHTIKYLCKLFDLKQKAEFTDVTSYKGLNQVVYKNINYNKINHEDKRFILSELDVEMEGKLGYFY